MRFFHLERFHPSLARLSAGVVSLALCWPLTLWAQNRAVDTDGSVELKGVVVVPSLLAVLILVVFCVLLALLVTVALQRVQERREADRTRRGLLTRIAAQEAELTRLRKTSNASTPGGAEDAP